jgi:AcrR family transcriptional regulator
MTASQDDRRANQKARTRAAIVEAAYRLQSQDVTPTVAMAADEARVSIATAYRYFPTQQALLVELQSESLFAPLDQVLDGLTSLDVEERLLSLLDAFERFAAANEPFMRMALRVYQDTWLRGGHDSVSPAPAVREGRRMLWLDKVLEPLDLPPDDKHRLKTSLALAVGPDSFVLLKDVCRLSNDEAAAVLREAATTLLRATLNNGKHETMQDPHRAS